MTNRLVHVRLLTLALGAALAVSAGPALAHGGGKGGQGGVGKQSLLAAAATYIGVTQAEINTARQAGQTLAQLATSKGKTVTGLTDALVATGNASIDASLAAGRVTAAQATAKKAGLQAEVTALINATGVGACSSGSGTSSKSSGKVAARRR